MAKDPRIALMLFCLLLNGCGWQTKISFPSPDGQKSVRILQPWPANSWGFKIELETGGNRAVVYERRKESIIYFMHVCWSRDSNSFAVLAAGFTQIQFAYDLRQRKEIPFQIMKDAMASSIRTTYRLDKDEAGTPIDPFEWAWSHKGSAGFTQLHPEAISK